MTLDELKHDVAKHTGVPAALLTGESEEELVSQAKALLAYRRDTANNEKTPRDQFAAWFSGEEEDVPADPADDVTPAYPFVRDGGEIPNAPTSIPARDQFAEWLGGF